MKSARHQAILDLIEQHPIDRQEDLLAHLREEGFDVTQATVSRDIRELQLVKTATADGRYRYVPASASGKVTHSPSRFEMICRESVLKVDYAGHMVLVKCFSRETSVVLFSVKSGSSEGFASQPENAAITARTISMVKIYLLSFIISSASYLSLPPTRLDTKWYFRVSLKTSSFFFSSARFLRYTWMSLFLSNRATDRAMDFSISCPGIPLSGRRSSVLSLP